MDTGPVYRYEQSYQFKKKGVKHTIKHQIFDGPKGLTIMFLKKVGEEFYKLYAKENEKEKGSFTLTEKVGEEETTKVINEKDLLKMLKTEKLEDAINFVTKERGTYKNKRISLKKNYERVTKNHENAASM
jgi:uncharacterized Fe-S center protein